MKDFYPTVLGSASAGLIARVICHPIDTVKSRLQAGQSAFRSLEGVSALYRGLGAVVVGGVPGVCIYMTSYEMCKERLSAIPLFRESPFALYLTAGMVAEAVCCIIFVPVDVIKERLQVQHTLPMVTADATSSSSGSSSRPIPHSSSGSSGSRLPVYKGSFDALLQISRQEGVRGIYKGYGATLLTYGPFSALYFYLYEELKKECTLRGSSPKSKEHSPSSKEHSLTFMETLGCSAIAGGIASAVTNPLDLAKLRLQVERGSIDPISPQEKGVIQMMKRVYINEGVRGLFRGAGARVLFHTPSTAITMATFEECKKRWAKILDL